jgi:uncharacterized protein
VAERVLRGDERLQLAGHRLLPLPEGQVGVLADRSTGWFVASASDYERLRAYLAGGRRTLRDADDAAAAVLEQLWSAGLLVADGSPHPDTHPPPRPYPNALLLKLTGACNFDCTYCYDYDRERFKARLDADAIRRTISALLRRTESLSIVFHGGEPLLRFDLLRDVVEFARAQAGEDRSIGFSIQTNGSLVTPEVVEFLDAHRFSVGLSVDGASDGANRLRHVRRGPGAFGHLERLLRRHPEFVRRRCGVLAVASRTSAPTLPDFALWLQERGVGGLSVSFLDLVGRGRDLADEKLTPEEAVDLYRRFVALVRAGDLSTLAFQSLIGRIANLFTFQPRDLCHKGPCGAANDFMVLDAEGTLRTCDCVYDDFFVIGAASEGVPDSRHPARQAVVDRHRRLRVTGATCRDCPLFGLCGGTCVAKAIANYGTPDSVDPVECALSRYIYPELLREFAAGGEQPLFAYYRRHRGAAHPLVAPA